MRNSARLSGEAHRRFTGAPYFRSGAAKKNLDRPVKTGKLSAKVEIKMKLKSSQTKLKRCSWWWRANPTG
jgi:hypothetical protein